VAAEGAGPSLGETLRLVLGLRFRLAARRLTGRGALGALLGGLVAAGLSLGLGWGSYLLFGRIEGIQASPVWTAFTLGLWCFLLGLFWVIWPVVAAQVDEAYELGRFLRFPVRPLRLYGLMTLVGLVEPAVLFFYPALVGAALGLSRGLAPGWGFSAGLMLAYTLMLVATGRALLNLFLNVMVSRRSGEILFVAFLLLLSLAALLPPVDAAWLFERLGSLGGTGADLALLANTASALAATPPGLLARGLAAAAAGETQAAWGALLTMLALGGTAWLVGLWLLKRYYRGGRGLRFLPVRPPAPPAPVATGWRLPWLSDAASAVFETELKALVSNPKARLLFAVPFFLVIILKVVGGAALLAWAWGGAWTAMLLAVLGLYVLSVLGGQLFANAFGYAGQAARWPFLTPAPLRDWLVGRNLAQAAFALAQLVGLGLVVLLLMPGASARLLGLPALLLPTALCLLLGVGNLVSIRHPRRFHHQLSRRDRPAAAAVMWTLGALGAMALAGLGALGVYGDGLALHLALGWLLVLAVIAYRALLKVAARRLGEGREHVIQAVTR
jgi:ABC-2 type transport system permease protein